MAMDAPDWQNIIVLTSGGGVSDAPDWQTLVTGPGGVPPVVGGGATGFIPSDYGWAAWACDPVSTKTQGWNTANTLLGTLVKCTSSTTVSNVLFHWISGVPTATAHENFIGVYTAGPALGSGTTLTLLGGTASGALEGTFSTLASFSHLPLSPSIALTSGTLYYVVVVMNITASTISFMAPALTIAGPLVALPPNDMWPFFLPLSATFTSLPSSIVLNTAAYEMNVSGFWAALY